MLKELLNQRLVGITFSSFDLFHAGHVQFLEMCKTSLGENSHMIACLHTDPTTDRPFKNKPVQSILERQMQLRGCKYVDEVIVYDTEQDVEDLLKLLQPHVRYMGSDYEGKSYTGDELGKQLGIKTIMIPRLHSFSSNSLRDRVAAQNEADDARQKEALDGITSGSA